MTDEKEYRSVVFVCETEVDVNEGDRGIAEIQLNPRPFIMTSMRHEIVKDGNAPTPPVQDGMYRINWTIDDQTQFFKGPAPLARSYLGSVDTGIWKNLDNPIEIRGSQNFAVTIINALPGRANPITVQIQLHGVERIR